jgi:hypothetical protein
LDIILLNSESLLFVTSIKKLIYVNLDINRVRLLTFRAPHLVLLDRFEVSSVEGIWLHTCVHFERPVSKTFDKDLERCPAHVQSIADGIDAAHVGHTVPVSEMYNSLRLVASPKNPRSPAFAEPAALDFAKVVAKISETDPLQGERVYTAVGDMLQKLQELPDLGVDGKHPDTRELVIYGYPVTLICTVGEDAAVTVVALFWRLGHDLAFEVKHTAQIPVQAPPLPT